MERKLWIKQTMSIQVVNCEFLTSCPSLEDLPELDLPEIAVIGRSNVGKSTLINRLTGRKKLAATSGNPGKTKTLNFFEVTLRTTSEKAMKLALVDLPGFGFAKFSKDERERLSRLTVDYFSNRDELKVVCLLNDIRRKPERDELVLRELLFEVGCHSLVIATKLDKLKRSQHAKELNKLAALYNLEADDLVATGEGFQATEIWERLLPTLE